MNALDKKIGTVLLVDDDPIIRGMLQIELEERYVTYTAESAERALEVAGNHSIDLIISDINMPGTSGYELLAQVRLKNPRTKTALITGYDVDNYIRLAKQHNISNIIPKSTPFNFDEFNAVVQNLVTEQIFGLSRYMLPDMVLVQTFKVLGSADIRPVQDSILREISRFHVPDVQVRVLLEELITNAIYHAPVDKDGNKKYEKLSPVVLEAAERVEISVAHDNEKYGVAVLDSSGKLTKDRVLYAIDRHICGEGLLDENGRGLHISRIYADRLIVNIDRNKKTEVIFMNYFDEKYKSSKPLYINEI